MTSVDQAICQYHEDKPINGPLNSDKLKSYVFSQNNCSLYPIFSSLYFCDMTSSKLTKKIIYDISGLVFM